MICVLFVVKLIRAMFVKLADFDNVKIIGIPGSISVARIRKNYTISKIYVAS